MKGERIVPRKNRVSVYTILYNKTTRLWECQERKSVFSEKTFKEPLVRQMAAWCQDRWKHGGLRSQLIVHGKNGRIQYERTYGEDPKRFPG